MTNLTDIAICLRLVDYSETSQIAVLFTQNAGKVSAIAKGAKRQTPSTLSKFSGGLELLARGEVVILNRPNSELGNLIEWDLHNAHWHLRQNLQAFRLAMYAADLVHHMVTDHDPHPRSFDAFAQLLKQLANAEEQAVALLRFQWDLIDDLGYRPTLDRDAHTGQPLPDNTAVLAFSPEAGGLVNDTGSGDRWRVRRQTIQLLYDIQTQQIVNTTNADAITRANQLLCSYLRHLLGRQLPTMDVVLD